MKKRRPALYWGLKARMRFLRGMAACSVNGVHFDFIPERAEDATQMERGTPYLAQFTYAKFSGDLEAMHRHEGYDVHAMYDVTRNIMLGQGVLIPYPDKYWTAEVFPNGCDQPGTAYLFSAEL